mgnify:CR=1 FL=1
MEGPAAPLEQIAALLDRAAADVRALAPDAAFDLVVSLTIDGDLQREAQAVSMEKTPKS